MLYHQDCYIPNETSKMLRMIYGENFLTQQTKKSILFKMKIKGNKGILF